MIASELAVAQNAAPASAQTQPELVSIIVCTYNQEQTVREAVLSALAQTYTPLEVIVSDDASTDGTFRSVQELSAGYEGPHELVLNRNVSNLGIARHWDAISRTAKGRLIVHAAGDDISVPTRVQELVKAWTGCTPRPYLLSSDGMNMTFEGVDTTPVVGLPESSTPVLQRTPKGVDFDAFDVYVCGFALAVDKRLYEKLPPLTTWMWSEDDILRSRALLLGPIAFLPRALVRYRDGGLSKGAEPSQASYLARFTAQARARLNYLEQLVTDHQLVHGRSAAFTGMAQKKVASARRRLALVERNFVQSMWTLLVQLAARERTDGVTRGQYVNIFLVRWFPKLFFGTRQLVHRLRAA